MKHRTVFLLTTVLFIAVFLPGAVLAEGTPATAVPPVPTPGMATMVDLGAHSCIPCKMMAPIIEELQKEYAGRASVIFIDVWERREQGGRFGIRAIPTQIFYDKDGKEAARHEGYLDKASIVAMFEKLGVKKAEAQANAQ